MTESAFFGVYGQCRNALSMVQICMCKALRFEPLILQRPEVVLYGKIRGPFFCARKRRRRRQGVGCSYQNLVEAVKGELELADVRLDAQAQGLRRAEAQVDDNIPARPSKARRGCSLLQQHTSSGNTLVNQPAPVAINCCSSSWHTPIESNVKGEQSSQPAPTPGQVTVPSIVNARRAETGKYVVLPD